MWQQALVDWILAFMKQTSTALDSRAVFARNLRMARRLRDISQEELGLDSGLSRAYVSSVEGGQRNISIDNMGRLAGALQVPLRDLVDPDRFAGLELG